MWHARCPESPLARLWQRALRWVFGSVNRAAHRTCSAAPLLKMVCRGWVYLLAALSVVVSGQLVSTGLSVTLNGVHYFISPFPAGNLAVRPATLSSVPAVHGFRPVAVVQEAPARCTLLPSLFANWTAEDDVFQAGFLGAVSLPGGLCSSTSRGVETGFGTRSVVLPAASRGVASGPYFLEAGTGSLFPVYRLYDDFAGAFTESLFGTPDGRFQTLSARIPGSATLTIGVPSRVYFEKTAARPLAGVRIAVKDIFRLAGVRGSNGNRAWYNLYPPSNVTGPAIQRLIDAGAQVVGLQKASQFANGEVATADWVDYHSPFNPRGDGYQDPSSSSSGAGASIASYGWLDMAVGTDTGGSIRGPAEAQGLFANRPSHGLVSLEQVMPLSTALDTVGLVLRDPFLWDAAQSALYRGSYRSLASVRPRYPSTVYTIGLPARNSTNSSAPLLVSFAKALAGFVGGSLRPIVLADAWVSSRPTAAGSATLAQLLNTTYATIISKQQISLVRQPFYSDYAGTVSTP